MSVIPMDYKVSVIISCYKNENDIERAIQSCVNQTLQEIEIIVVNDGSPDNSQNIVDQMVKKYPEKVFSYVKENGGIASVRNFGMNHVHGEYFGFLDGDDYAEPEMFEKLYLRAKSENSEMTCGQLFFTFESHEKPFYEAHYFDASSMIQDVYCVVWNKIYKTDWIRNLGVQFPLGCRFEDVSFLYKIAPHLKKNSYVDECFVHYVQREGSITASHNDKVKQVVVVWNDLIDYYQNNQVYDKYRNELEYAMIKFMLGQPFRSACKIKDKEDRKKTLGLLWENLNEKFPDWRKNPILRSRKDAKHTYFKMVNKFSFKIFSFIFSML